LTLGYKLSAFKNDRQAPGQLSTKSEITMFCSLAFAVVRKCWNQNNVGPNISDRPFCDSVRGPDADRRRKSLFYFSARSFRSA